MIINKLKKDYGLKELAFKHKSATENILTHSNKSLVVVFQKIKAIIEDKNVLFFDCSGFYSSSLKKRAPGTKHLPPQTNKQQSTYGLNMATLVGLKSPIAMAFKKKGFTSRELSFFQKQCIIKLKRDTVSDEHGWIIVLDNSPLHKTDEFIYQKLIKEPIQLQFSVPMSPWINFIEKYFLFLKKGQRQKRSITAHNLKEVVEKTIKNIDDMSFRGIVGVWLQELLEKVNNIDKFDL